jgi:hypothetical protein
MTDFFPDRWWNEHDEVVRLAYWMLEHHETARNIVLMVEKPWKYEDEYAECMADNAAEEAAAEQHMHRNRGESYTAMLARTRTQTPVVTP